MKPSIHHEKPPPDPLPTGRGPWRWGLLGLIWAVIGLMFVAPTYIQLVAAGVELPWPRMISELASWYLWAAFLPAIVWVARRFPFGRRTWLKCLLIHFAFGAVIAVCYATLEACKNFLVIAFTTGDFRPHLLAMGPIYLLGGFHLYLLIYSSIVALTHAFDYYRKFRERELKASRLEAQLARAQLQVLKMQLHPHFLFNTLHAISALMHRDVDRADRMVIQLSDFLRLSLENAGRQRVTLRRELEFLDCYLEIEKTRFGDRLSGEIDVPPELLDAKVPNLILQPLAENSIKHGLSVRGGPGTITVHAARESEQTMRLEVSDNGPGVEEGDAVLGVGVGLSNTQARLAQLYGAGHEFSAGNMPSGGFRVAMIVPLHLPRRHEERREEALPLAVAEVAARST